MEVEQTGIHPAVRSTSGWFPQSARTKVSGFFDKVGERSILSLLMIWLLMIVGFGLIYWINGFFSGHGLVDRGRDLGESPSDLGTALYFSFVTALSIGYGDILPRGLLRVFAIIEGAGGLLLFGIVVSKLVSRRQELATEEIHRLTFENRLGRVRTNLHMVLADLQGVTQLCNSPDITRAQVQVRIESAIAVFTGELNTIHDLLYRPQQLPDEQELASILAGLAQGLRGIREMKSCAMAIDASTSLRASLRVLTSLANEICGECVPRDYAPHLKVWMDQIQELSVGLDS